jgi:DNA-binding XRE family transcriptional regulator
MGRMRKLSAEERQAERRAFYDATPTSAIDLAEAVRQMRRITGLTQAEFAERVAGISTGALAQIEAGTGNPTLDTLNKIGAAFGVEVAFVRRS